METSLCSLVHTLPRCLVCPLAGMPSLLTLPTLLPSVLGSCPGGPFLAYVPTSPPAPGQGLFSPGTHLFSTSGWGGGSPVTSILQLMPPQEPLSLHVSQGLGGSKSVPVLFRC